MMELVCSIVAAHIVDHFAGTIESTSFGNQSLDFIVAECQEGKLKIVRENEGSFVGFNEYSMHRSFVLRRGSSQL